MKYAPSCVLCRQEQQNEQTALAAGLTAGMPESAAVDATTTAEAAAGNFEDLERVVDEMH